MLALSEMSDPNGDLFQRLIGCGNGRGLVINVSDDADAEPRKDRLKRMEVGVQVEGEVVVGSSLPVICFRSRR